VSSVLLEPLHRKLSIRYYKNHSRFRIVRRCTQILYDGTYGRTRCCSHWQCYTIGAATWHEKLSSSIHNLGVIPSSWNFKIYIVACCKKYSIFIRNFKIYEAWSDFTRIAWIFTPTISLTRICRSGHRNPLLWNEPYINLAIAERPNQYRA